MAHDLLRRIVATAMSGEAPEVYAIHPDRQRYIALTHHLADLLRDRDDLAARLELERRAHAGET